MVDFISSSAFKPRLLPFKSTTVYDLIRKIGIRQAGGSDETWGTIIQIIISAYGRMPWLGLLWEGQSNKDDGCALFVPNIIGNRRVTRLGFWFVNSDISNIHFFSAELEGW